MSTLGSKARAQLLQVDSTSGLQKFTYGIMSANRVYLIGAGVLVAGLVVTHLIVLFSINSFTPSKDSTPADTIAIINLVLTLLLILVAGLFFADADNYFKLIKRATYADFENGLFTDPAVADEIDRQKVLDIKIRSELQAKKEADERAAARLGRFAGGSVTGSISGGGFTVQPFHPGSLGETTST